MKLGARLQPLPDAGLAVRRESLLDVVHLDSLWTVARLLEQSVYENLETMPFS